MSNKMLIRIGLLTVLACVAALALLAPRWMQRQTVKAAIQAKRVVGKIPGIRRAWGKKSLRYRVKQYGKSARRRLAPYFKKAKVAYPPHAMRLVGFKREKRLELYARARRGKWKLVRSYPVLAASGDDGPKLREGDMQVPEGIYRVNYLHPNSQFHLALRLNYPSYRDRLQGRRDKRRGLGSDIMIHGNQVSIGCIAIGDTAIEELFVLGADVGMRKISVIITPADPRKVKLSKIASKLKRRIPWIRTRYKRIQKALKRTWN